MAEFLRLNENSLAQDGQALRQAASAKWRLRGRHDPASGRYWLGIDISGEQRVVCQRCLEPFEQCLRVERSLCVARSQAELDALDSLEATGEGAELEYILADVRLDVLQLLEDELILVAPFAPRHEHCPRELAADDGARAASPFAVLGQLKKTD